MPVVSLSARRVHSSKSQHTDRWGWPAWHGGEQRRPGEAQTGVLEKGGNGL